MPSRTRRRLRCPDCEKKFFRKGMLNRHKREFHSSAQVPPSARSPSSTAASTRRGDSCIHVRLPSNSDTFGTEDAEASARLITDTGEGRREFYDPVRGFKRWVDDGSHVQSLQKAEDGVDVPDQADSSEDATPPPLAMENSWADPGASPAGMHNLRNHQNDGGNMAASLSSLTTSSGLDREIVRQLPRMVQEENQAMLHGDTAPILTTSTCSSVRSDDALYLFDSASSFRIISNTLPDDDSASVMTTNPTKSAKQRGTFVCGFCSEEGITKTCTRKNDLKWHIEDFHSINSLWFCNHDGCSMVFDSPTVYKTHMENAHGGSISIVADDVRVTLCPQTVFACGFDRCIQVFESRSDAEAPSTLKEYVAHVIKHLDDVGSSSSSSSSSSNNTPGLQWSYSTRLRNLMRQSAVLNTWLDSYSEADREALQWQPQTTGVLRKLLETRHILPRDVNLLVQYAFALGSNLPLPSVPGIHDVFRIPVSQECQMQVSGHQPARPLTMMHQPSPLAQQQQLQIRTPQQSHQQHHHMVQPPPPPQQHSEADQFSRLSAPPHLAHYDAAQRRTFHARPPVRSGRSARPPTMSQQQQQQQHQGYHHQQPQQQHGMFDTSGAGMWQQQHQQPYAQMTPDRGIQAIRGSGGTADVVDADIEVDMGDAHMTDLSGYTMTPAAHTTSSAAAHSSLGGVTPSAYTRGLGVGGDRKQGKRRGNLPKEKTEKLRHWLKDHLHHPYPTEEEKQALSRQTGLQMCQISNWFINARRRQLPTMISTTTLTTS